MARYRRYLETDVLTAAKERIHHVFDIFDSVAVAFSGGKDSLTTLHLTWEVARERGLDHVEVFFRDEEVIPDLVLDFVREVSEYPWVNLRWYCIPLKSTKFILGRTFEYVQWGPGRAWAREKPPWGISLEPGDTRTFSQYEADEYLARPYRGKTCFLTGIRASESIMRYRACMVKLNENYITATECPRVMLGKPIYDWEEDDVFKFFMETGVKFCPLYRVQNLAGESLRVATPFIAESAKHLHKVRETTPEFYDRIIRVFPEMAVQDRYWKELDREAIKRRYGRSWEGLLAYIEENITDEPQYRKAVRMLEKTRVRASNCPEAYPLKYVLQWLVTGGFKRECLPLPRAQRPKAEGAK